MAADEDLPSWFDEFMVMDDAAAWTLALERARHVPVDEPHVNTDEDRAQAAADRQVYTEQKDVERLEVSERATAAARAVAGLGRLTPSRKRSLERFVCVCPTPRQCHLVEAYAWSAPKEAPMSPTQPTLLLVTSTRHKKRAAWPEWHLTQWREPESWLAIGCQHGAGRFPTYASSEVLRGLFDTTGRKTRRTIDQLLGAPGVQWCPTSRTVRT